MKKPHYLLLVIFTILIQSYFSIASGIVEKYQRESSSDSPDLTLQIRFARADSKKYVFHDLIAAGKEDEYILSFYRPFDDTVGILNLTQEPIIMDQAASFPVYDAAENQPVALIRKDSDWNHRINNDTVQLNDKVFRVIGYFTNENPYIDESTNVIFSLTPDQLDVGKYEVRGLQTENHRLVMAPFSQLGEVSQQAGSTSKRPLFFYLLYDNYMIQMSLTILVSLVSIAIFVYFILLESKTKRNIHAIYGASSRAYLMKELNKMKFPVVLSIFIASSLYLLFIALNDYFDLDLQQLVLILVAAFLSGGLFILLYIFVYYLTGKFTSNREALI